jgi:hypothetical protein
MTAASKSKFISIVAGACLWGAHVMAAKGYAR